MYTKYKINRKLVVKPQISLVTMYQYFAKLTCLFITLLALDRFHFTSVVYNKNEFFFLKN